MAEDPTAAPAAAASPTAPAPTIAHDLAGVIAALIRNGLSNGPIAQSAATWDHLATRLPEIVAAIIKEL